MPTFKCYYQTQLVKTTTSWQEAKEWERSETLNYFLIECIPENLVETEKEKAKPL